MANTPDDSNMKSLLLLWLVVSTEMGNSTRTGLYFSQLSDPTSPAQTDLVNRLKIPADTVKKFIDTATDPANSAQVQDVQETFHKFIKAVSDTDYDGPFCPFENTSFFDLIPAP